MIPEIDGQDYVRQRPKDHSITRSIAGCLRFFTFTQCFDLPLW
jgi:hypothetical protein